MSSSDSADVRDLLAAWDAETAAFMRELPAQDEQQLAAVLAKLSEPLDLDAVLSFQSSLTLGRVSQNPESDP